MLDAGRVTGAPRLRCLDRASDRKLGRVLTDLNLVREETLHELLAQHLQIPFVDVRQMTLDPNVVRLLPEAHARRYAHLDRYVEEVVRPDLAAWEEAHSKGVPFEPEKSSPHWAKYREGMTPVLGARRIA